MTVNVGGKQIKRGEQVSTEEKKEEEVKFNPADYSCEVLLEKTTPDKAQDPKFPTDAFNVTYEVDGEQRLDVTRSNKKVNIFDYYWDKYGKGLKSIDYGHGTINPNRWGYKEPPKKKRRKG